MENQVTNNANALRLFFTEDVFLVNDETVEIPHLTVGKPFSASPETIEIISEKDVSQQDKPIILAENKAVETKKYTPDIEIPRIVNEPKASPDFKFLGGNKKSVLILVNDNLNDVSTAQGRELLRKIVKAIDLSTPDFALLNYAQYIGTDFASLQYFFKPVIMLSFGVESSELKLDLKWNNEIILHQATKIIFAPNLHQLDSDVSAKKLLWGNLQRLNA